MKKKYAPERESFFFLGVMLGGLLRRFDPTDECAVLHRRNHRSNIGRDTVRASGQESAGSFELSSEYVGVAMATYPTWSMVRSPKMTLRTV